MITKRGTLKCDHCGRFISWSAVEALEATCTYHEWVVTTLGGPEIMDELIGECYTCRRKLGKVL